MRSAFDLKERSAAASLRRRLVGGEWGMGAEEVREERRKRSVRGMSGGIVVGGSGGAAVVVILDLGKRRVRVGVRVYCGAAGNAAMGSTVSREGGKQRNSLVPRGPPSG